MIAFEDDDSFIETYVWFDVFLYYKNWCFFINYWKYIMILCSDD